MTRTRPTAAEEAQRAGVPSPLYWGSPDVLDAKGAAEHAAAIAYLQETLGWGGFGGVDDRPAFDLDGTPNSPGFDLDVALDATSDSAAVGKTLGGAVGAVGGAVASLLSGGAEQATDADLTPILIGGAVAAGLIVVALVSR